MADLVASLMKHSLIYLNPLSQWPCAPFFLPKCGSAHYHFMIDNSSMGRLTKPCYFVMSIVQKVLTKTAGSRDFETLYICTATGSFYYTTCLKNFNPSKLLVMYTCLPESCVVLPMQVFNHTCSSP